MGPLFYVGKGWCLFCTLKHWWLEGWRIRVLICFAALLPAQSLSFLPTSAFDVCCLCAEMVCFTNLVGANKAQTLIFFSCLSRCTKQLLNVALFYQLCPVTDIYVDGEGNSKGAKTQAWEAAGEDLLQVLSRHPNKSLPSIYYFIIYLKWDRPLCVCVHVYTYV